MALRSILSTYRLQVIRYRLYVLSLSSTHALQSRFGRHNLPITFIYHSACLALGLVIDLLKDYTGWHSCICHHTGYGLISYLIQYTHRTRLYVNTGYYGRHTHTNKRRIRITSFVINTSFTWHSLFIPFYTKEKRKRCAYCWPVNAPRLRLKNKTRHYA